MGCTQQRTCPRSPPPPSPNLALPPQPAAAGPHLVDGLHAAHEPLLELVVLWVVLQPLLVGLNGLVVLLWCVGARAKKEGMQWCERAFSVNPAGWSIPGAPCGGSKRSARMERKRQQLRCAISPVLLQQEQGMSACAWGAAGSAMERCGRRPGMQHAPMHMQLACTWCTPADKERA